MLYSVLTTINPPTAQVEVLANQHKKNLGEIIVIADLKGPADYKLDHTKLISLADQNKFFPAFSDSLPLNHYSRKNIGYLIAMNLGASCIYETDDDNEPNESWAPRQQKLVSYKTVNASAGWLNVYRYFAEGHVWPRGLPLDQISNKAPKLSQIINQPIDSPIQQGLVDHSPDVDAIWRLTMGDKPFNFDRNMMSSVLVPKGVWVPFNTQSTWWWPLAYPLMYVPSYCSFRMCDIWRSFVAQRCLWALGYLLTFHPPEVIQLRNPHNLNKDFEDEIPGYLLNQKIIEVLESLKLSSNKSDVINNLLRCYRSLVEHEIFPSEELSLVRQWSQQVAKIFTPNPHNT